jgi:hypothetical protein
VLSETPDPLGPRNRGQSSARQVLTAMIPIANTIRIFL